MKWKIAVIIGGFFLLLHSVFSYLIYLDTTDDFVQTRKNIVARNSNTARALTNDSFLVLDQFAELFSVMNFDIQDQHNALLQIDSVLDKNWQQWQFIWGLESAVFFNKSGIVEKQWGSQLIPDPASVLQVLNKELPVHRIVCPDACYQFVIIPVMENSVVVGVFGVSRSFADMVIKYNLATTGSDIGVMVSGKNSLESTWPYQISAITHAESNESILNHIVQEYMFSDFLDKRKVVVHQDQSYEMSIFSVTAGVESKTPPFFLIIENISNELNEVYANLKTIWLYGLYSWVVSLLFLIVVLIFSFRRVNTLSDALPLLAKQQYNEFRLILKHKNKLLVGYDELDILTDTALTLTDQLENLEKEIKDSFSKLIEQGQDLMTERDFNERLINVAPILVITQDCNGIILSINKAGVEEFSMEESLIIGSVFDNFIPDSEIEHLTNLKQLRTGGCSEHIRIEGILIVNPDYQRQISWIHSLVKPKRNDKPHFILSLGVDVSERKHIEDKMLRMATHDQLTGMSNRRFFQTECLREITSAKRYGTQLALFYLDLDQFKIVNDINGHEAGDQLLKLVSITLQEVVRGTDVVSRIGGDEFTVIMPNAEKQGIENVANKINESLKSLEFWVDDRVYKISASIGVAIYPQHGSDVSELLSNADLAMYQAKAAGPGQFHIFLPGKDYQSRLSSRLYWKDVISDAINNQRFVLYYQPILNLQTGQTCHFECLTRIKTYDNRLLMPAEFIGFAEELGLMGKIDLIVVKKAILQSKKFTENGRNDKLVVNLSGRSLNEITIFEDISALIIESEINPEQIIFEMTETAAISNFSSAKEFIKKIKCLGCAFCLDDFGVGFSSFYYLKHLPVDFVKIDGSFIRQLDNNHEDKVFVKALTEVSQALGKKTVAAFTENEAVLRVLKDLGVDYAQGYHIGKPELFD